MPKKSNKQLLEENAALKTEMLQMSASKANDNNSDNNSVASSQSSRKSRDSQRSVVTEAVTKFYVPPGIVSGGAVKPTTLPSPTNVSFEDSRLKYLENLVGDLLFPVR